MDKDNLMKFVKYYRYTFYIKLNSPLADDGVDSLPSDIMYEFKLKRADPRDSIVCAPLNILSGTDGLQSNEFTAQQYTKIHAEWDGAILEPVFCAALCVDRSEINKFQSGHKMNLNHNYIKQYVLESGRSNYNISLR